MLRFARTGLRAHRLTFAGTAVIIALAAGLLSMTGVVVQTGLAHPFEGGLLLTLAESFAGTAVVAVALVLAVTVNLTLRQRRREFALLLAVGATRRQVRRLITLEIGLLTVLAAPLGAAAGLLAAPVMTPLLERAQIVPDGFTLDRAPWPVLGATIILLLVTSIAARLAARETVRIAPTAAVRESTVEPRTVGRARRIGALALATAGLPVACTPVFLPGTAGSAAAATSAFLLIGAAALAGPVLIGWIFERTSQWQVGVRSAPVRLALANSRGFARRLTTVIVPLAVALSVGTVQTGVTRSVDVATVQQLRAGIRADVVVTSPEGLTMQQVSTLRAAPGVRAVEPTTTVPVQVKTDDEAPSALAWEYTSLRAVTPAATSLLDIGVTHGSLTALARPATVAISEDSRLDAGGGLGHHLTVRGVDGTERTVTVAAVYKRGLAFGDYLVGPTTMRTLAPHARPDTVYVQASSAATPEALRVAGLTATDKDAYVRHATTATGAMQHLSATLLLTLLVFIGLAAANTLVLTTVGRRRELDLLRRTGATRRQLVTMSAVESLIAALTAWSIGTVAVVPALLGVNYGLTGTAFPRFDIPAYVTLSVVVFAVPLLCTVPTVLRQLRSGVTPRRGPWFLPALTSGH